MNKTKLKNKLKLLGLKVKKASSVEEVLLNIATVFPNNMELNSELNIYGELEFDFIVGEEYSGATPSKKVMMEIDKDYKELLRVYGLSVKGVKSECEVKLYSDVGIDYTDKWGIRHYTPFDIHSEII